MATFLLQEAVFCFTWTTFKGNLRDFKACRLSYSSTNSREMPMRVTTLIVYVNWHCRDKSVDQM